MGIRLALEVWGNDYRQLVDTAQAAEALGFAGLYYGEAPHGLNLETWTVLAGLAERTTTLRLGPVITNLLPAYRSFPLFARQVHTVAVLARDRLDLRTGTGAATAWARPWWEPAGVDYPERATRRAVLRDWLRALHHLWASPGEPYRGPHVRFDALRLEPRVPRPPITVAAVGPASMRIAARYADGWESSFLTPSEFGALATRFDELAGDRARDISRSVELDAVTGPTGADRRERTARFLAERGATGEEALARALTGSAERLAERLTEYRVAGVDQLLLAAVDPHDHRALETLAEASAHVAARP